MCVCTKLCTYVDNLHYHYIIIIPTCMYNIHHIDTCLHTYTQCLVSVVSEKSAKLNHCSDHISLAYISNKPILIVATQPKTETIKHFDFGM